MVRTNFSIFTVTGVWHNCVSVLQKMDDYTEPKDSKKMVWSLMKSEVGASALSQGEEEEEEDHYSEPYQQAAGSRHVQRSSQWG